MIKWINIEDELPKDYAYTSAMAPTILFCLYGKYIHGGWFLEGKFYSDDDNWYEREEVTHWAECNMPE